MFVPRRDSQDYVTHKGDAQRVFMEPGDVVLYEGASMLHGRKDPLEGDQFTNVFFHFRSPNWLPAVQAKLDKYWDTRGAYEKAAGKGLTSLGQAPKLQRKWTGADQVHKRNTRERREKERETETDRDTSGVAIFLVYMSHSFFLVLLFFSVHSSA